MFFADINTMYKILETELKEKHQEQKPKIIFESSRNDDKPPTGGVGEGRKR